MFTFRGMPDDADRLNRRIRGMLGRRQVMNIGELRMRLGGDKGAVQAELEAMMERGEIERLRPIDYSGEDYDFFRLMDHPLHGNDGGQEACFANREGGTRQARLMGKDMACLAD